MFDFLRRKTKGNGKENTVAEPMSANAESVNEKILSEEEVVSEAVSSESMSLDDITRFMEETRFQVPVNADGTVRMLGGSEKIDTAIAEGTIIESEVEEIPYEQYADDELRMNYLSTIMLHYYLSCWRSWLEAVFTAFDEIPAICLYVEGSPVEYTDADEADKVAEDLGFENWSGLTEMAEQRISDFPFLRKFAENTLSIAKKFWFDDLEDATPEEYAQAVINEIRSNIPAAKSRADMLWTAIQEPLPNGFVDTPNGAGYISGVQTVDSGARPESMAIMPKDAWEAGNNKFAEYARSKSRIADDAGNIAFDEDILSLVYLQCYIWSNRSWNKVVGLAENFLGSCYTYAMSCISPEYVIIDPDQVEQNAKRLDEIASELMDENGNVSLRQIVPGDPEDPNTLDAVSREFLQLLGEQEKADFISGVNQTIAYLLEFVAGTEQTTAGAVIDEFLTCCWAQADLTLPASQDRVMRQVMSNAVETLRAKEKSYKSYWKKYLEKNRDAADLVKKGVRVSNIADGEPIFSKRSISAVQEETEEVFAIREDEAAGD